MVDDARNSAQKAQSDKATQRDAQLAQTLEKERLAQEKAALTPPVSKTLSSRKVKKVAPTSDARSTTQYPEVTHKITPKRLKSPAKKPAYFEAQVPGSEKKAVSKKKPKKKVVAG